MSGTLSPTSASDAARICCCSSKEQAWISEECPLTVTADTPGTKAQSRTCLRVCFSSMLMSSLNASRVAGMTPSRRKSLNRGMFVSLRMGAHSIVPQAAGDADRLARNIVSLVRSQESYGLGYVARQAGATQRD